MEYSFTVQKGSNDGKIVAAITKRVLASNEAYIQMMHSGVCGTDEHYRHTDMVLRHEGVGIVQAIGTNVKAVAVGDRVGFGYVRKVCAHCEYCLTGKDAYCSNAGLYGFHDHDIGSFATHTVWDAEALIQLPHELENLSAGLLMCSGATVWGALALYGVKPNDRVGIVGIGGLAHLAIQFAAKMGCEMVVFSTTESKREEALKFGASEFHVLTDSSSVEGISKINQMLLCGSAQPDYTRIISLTAAGGTIFALTVSSDLTSVPMIGLLANGTNIQGSAVAPRQHVKNMMEFCVRHGIKPKTMTWPLNTKYTGCERFYTDVKRWENEIPRRFSCRTEIADKFSNISIESLLVSLVNALPRLH